MPEQSVQKPGRIIEIKGVVIDVVFPEGLPEIYSALSIDIPEREGQEARETPANLGRVPTDDLLSANCCPEPQPFCSRASGVFKRLDGGSAKREAF